MGQAGSSPAHLSPLPPRPDTQTPRHRPAKLSPTTGSGPRYPSALDTPTLPALGRLASSYPFN